MTHIQNYNGTIVSRTVALNSPPDYLPTIGTQPFIFGTNYSRSFNKTSEEKSLARAYHADWKRKMKNAYGEKWRKYDNPPGVV